MSNELSLFQELSTTTLSDVLTRNQVMNFKIHALWQNMPRVAGPAFTVKCPPGDNLMLHAAIYRAPKGSVIVVESGDVDYAAAGGNVCAVAQKNGIAAFVIDGVIRDLAEVKEMGFPVFAQGIIPIPGGKEIVSELNIPIRCGGVEVFPGDLVVADEEGIVVVPFAKKEAVLKAAQAKAAKDASTSLSDWETAHRAKIEEILTKKGFSK